MEFLLLWIVVAVACGIVAKNKGRSFGGWFVIGFLLSLLGLLLILVLPAIDSERTGGPTKKCPACAEIVKAEAKICRYCRHDFDGDDDYEPVEPRRQPAVVRGAPPRRVFNPPLK